MSMDEYDLEQLDRQLDRVKAQVFLGKNSGFLAPLMCSMDFIWTEETPTSDTDGVRLRWNPKDFLQCTPDGRISSLLHELAHVYRMHPLRRGERCPDVWNIACDVAINRDLLTSGYKLEWGSNVGIGMCPEIPFQLEEEIYDYFQKLGQNAPQPKCGNGLCGGMPPLNNTGKQTLINNVVKAVHTAIANGQAGDIPGNTEMIVNKFLKPKIPWETALYLFFNDLQEDDYSWRRPNRRHQEMYLPSRVDDIGRLDSLNYYLDVSGSVSDHDVLRFNSEVKYIKDTFNPKKLTLLLFDTYIRKEIVFTEDDSFDEIIVVGRGGTDLIPVRKHIMDNEPDAAIIFSDLFVEPMKPGPRCPVLWVAVQNASAKVLFGKLIHIRG